LIASIARSLAPLWMTREVTEHFHSLNELASNTV
jgi:hypothetical protein